MTDIALLDGLTAARYAQLRTYRRDGVGVDTPIWFYVDGDSLFFRTKVGPKTRRLTADPRVELWPCDHRGRYATATPTVTGTASILEGRAAEAANRELHRRYGWQYNVVPLLKVPGVKNVHSGLPLREKLRRATTRSLWPDSAIVEVKLDRSDPGIAAPETI
ncbi:PPOX class F420-dependent oxidoreductase [Mycobacterium sp. URHB0044]|jgi:PPOX class probable F420-dependent enzyme|uniref:PPOX class F420-dependent oxidoreductase n=1 Tax=Mycobacterium sp. URHB0044 TaxID=1380386 RepID=UPI0006858F54|nr:PPOX class F420-dependent oxidoreductase [Mycobacterium sp. URHB0044]